MKRLRTSAPLAALALAWVGCVEVTGTGPVIGDVPAPVFGSVEPSPIGSAGGTGNGSSEPTSPVAADAGDGASASDASSARDAGKDNDTDDSDETDTDAGSSKRGDMGDGLLPF